MKEGSMFLSLFFLMLASSLILARNVDAPSPLMFQVNVQWDKTYGGTQEDSALAVIQTGEGGYALGGGTYSYGSGQADFWLIKTDADGNVQWDKTYGGIERDGAHSLIQTRDGGYAIVGYTGSFGAGYATWDCWLVKTDGNGNMQWSFQYGGESEDYGYYVVQTNDGGYAIVGQTLSFGAGSSDGWLIKVRADGTMDWVKTYGGAGWDWLCSVVQTNDGGLMMVGCTGTVLVEDFWIVKTDADGDMQWEKIFGGSGRDILRSVMKTSDGRYVAVGYTSPFPEPGPFDACLVMFDDDGTLQPVITYGGTDNENALAVAQSSDGGYAIAGLVGSPDAGTTDFWVFETDASGNTLWDHRCGGSGRDEAYSLIQTSDDGYAVAGFTRSFDAGDFDCWLVKLCVSPIPKPVIPEVSLGTGMSFLGMIAVLAVFIGFKRARSNSERALEEE